MAINQFPGTATAAFLPGKRSFKEEYRIRGYEVSPDQRATIVTIANLLQEVAGNHAVGMWGRSDEGFASLPVLKDYLFVMTRLQIRMYTYPKWGDVVSVETYFTEEGRLAFRREWRITDVATGELLGAATSTWVTINTATRRLAKLPEDVRKRFLRFGPSGDVQILPVEETRKKLPDMELPGEIQAPVQVARRSDMDMNGHINNVTYLAWTLESMPEDVYLGCKLKELEVDFKAECQAGNTIHAHSSPLPPGDGDAGAANGNGHCATRQYLHVLQRCDGDACAELVRARSTWEHV